MRIRLLGRAALAALAVLLSVQPAHAQPYESVGIRAQGMGGAFVALADDASATWWNPAGIATGAYLDSLLEFGVVQEPGEELTPAGQLRPAAETRGRGIAISFPAGAFSYYRLQISEMQPLGPTGQPLSGREEQRATSARLRTALLNQFGATFGQSLGKYLVVASTLKLVRGWVSDAVVAPGDASFEAARELEGDADYKVDLDIGALASIGVLRLGASMRNVRSPEFGPDGAEYELKQRSRAGVAVVGQPGGFDQVSVSADVDLTSAVTVLGDTRYVALGAEAWMFNKLVGARGGLSRNLEGQELISPSVGGSVAFRRGAYIEGQYTFGSDDARRGWGFSTRVTF